MKNGLPSDVVYGILEDSSGNLWLSTNYGLSRFNQDTETFKNFDTRDGLLGNEYNTGAWARTAEGTFLFGGVNGASEFNPDSLVDNPFIAPVVLTGFNIFDKPAVLKKSITSTEEITLSYRDNYFSFEFASLDFSTPDRNQYAYMLEGLDRDWIRAGTRRFAGYTHLDAGRYVFRVKGTNGDGVWNEAGASVRIIITPPFWKTWWFIVLLIMAIGGGIAFLIVNRVRQLLAIERLRSKIAADLHDDIGAGLTEISIMGEVITQKLPPESRRLILPEAEKIGETARGLVSSMSDIVWLVDPRRDSLYDLVSRLGDSFKETMNTLNIQFKTENLQSLKSVRLKMEYRQHLLLIFKEAINNSLKYSGCSEISLSVDLRGKMLDMCLIDNGRGFEIEDEPAGNGLKNMKERADRIGGVLVIRSSSGRGTEVEFSGPVSRA
jgi:two-component sensor histidine kinase